MSTTELAASAVVVDIEGTTSPTAAVHSVLFPYAEARLDRYVHEHAADDEVRRVLAQVDELAGAPLSLDDAIDQLRTWSRRDDKVTPLKTLQGLIWRDGFAAGELHGVLFDDVAPSLRRWHADGLVLAVFSSGSVLAQQGWFATCPEGDLRSSFAGFFDTDNAGAKRVPASYVRIAGELGCDGAAVVFLSDVLEELDAARDAGWQSVGVRRDGEPQYERGTGDHREVGRFTELSIRAVVRQQRGTP